MFRRKVEHEEFNRETDRLDERIDRRKEEIRELANAMNEQRRQVNKNTTRIEGLLGTSAMKNLLACGSPDMLDDAKALCPQPQEGAGRKKRKTRKRKGGLPECGMVENPDEWCKQQALSGNIEDNENTMCNLETGKCVKPPALHRHFQSPQGRRAYQRIQARRQDDVPAGGRKKRRKTRKRRRKKRTKKKTRRKRRKSRKRKPKRRRKKKTRKRKAGCWPFCRRRPRVLEEEPLVQQQQEAPQEAPNENPREKAARLQHEFEGLKSSRTRHYQDEMNRRLDARKTKQREVGGTQGGD